MWGRFLNADALLGKGGKLLSHILFAYCENNPISYADPDGFPVVKPFREYNNKNKQKIIQMMLTTNNGHHGFHIAKIELLHGSHSAEVRMTVFDRFGKPTNSSIVVTQVYDVIPEMMDELLSIVHQYGGTYHHEGVEWQYTMQ